MDNKKRRIGAFIAAILAISVLAVMPASATDGGVFWVSNDEWGEEGVVFRITLDKEITFPIAGFDSPEGLEIRTSSPAELFIIETDEDRIWKYDTSTGALSIYADLSAYVVDLQSLAFDDNGVLFATDDVAETVWRIDDLNGDGDALDAGEVTVFINESSVRTDTGYGLEDPESIVFAASSSGVFYVGDENETDGSDGFIFRVLPDGTANIYATGKSLLALTGHDTGGEFEALEVNPFTGELYASDDDTIWALRDLNGDGDAMDAGEATFIANESTISADTGVPEGDIDIKGLAFDDAGALYVSGEEYIFKIASSATVFVGPDDFVAAGFTGDLDLDDIVYLRLRRKPAPVSALTPIGLIALVGLLSVIAAVSIRATVRKKRE